MLPPAPASQRESEACRQPRGRLAIDQQPRAVIGNAGDILGRVVSVFHGADRDVADLAATAAAMHVVVDDQGRGGMLVEPGARPIVDLDAKHRGRHHELIMRGGRRCYWTMSIQTSPGGSGTAWPLSSVKTSGPWLSGDDHEPEYSWPL